MVKVLLESILFRAGSSPLDMWSLWMENPAVCTLCFSERLTVVRGMEVLLFLHGFGNYVVNCQRKLEFSEKFPRVHGENMQKKIKKHKQTMG